MIASIDFKDFKILREARIEFSPFNLIIGPNGSGKTSVIEAIRRLRNLASLPIVTSSVPAPPRASRLEFHFDPPQSGLSVVLSCTPDLACDGLQLVGTDAAQQNWRALADKLSMIRFHALDPVAMARPCSADAPCELAEDGANIAAALHSLNGKAPSDFSAIVAEFTRILPEFSKIETVATRGNVEIEFELRDEGHAIGAGDLSQGTLALLGILFLASAAPRPSLLCIEEIDRGLHPRVLREARDALYRLSHPTDDAPSCQVLATTHSPYLLDLFRDQPEEVIIAEKTGARAGFRKLSEFPDLKELLSEASLGDLWFSGVLGGVPDEE
ncbi:MAG TPA: AAA family ATPase [Opitutaceae bacterium]|nr:AAA family ATPase [Opitutaceae bacterium]